MSHPVVSIRTYVLVFLALIALTVTTVLVSKLELGEFNFVAAMTIAVIKGTLVLLFFMHVKQASSMTKVFVAAGFFWLAIMLVLVFADYSTRGWQAQPVFWGS